MSVFGCRSPLLPQLDLSHNVLPILTITLSFLCIISNYSITPLKQIPGPFLASISSLWLVKITRQRRRHLHDIALHRKYGPIVRVGPNEVSLASPAAVKLLYGMLPKKLMA